MPDVSVLLVESDPLLRRSTARNLRAHGYRVIACGTAVGAMSEEPADVGVIGLKLAGTNGVALATQLLADKRIGYAVFLTATDDHVLLARAARVGVVIDPRLGPAALREALPRSAGGTKP